MKRVNVYEICPVLCVSLAMMLLLGGCGGTSTPVIPVTPAAPAITSFVASPATITAGSNSSLTAVFTNGTGVITPGNIAVTSNIAVSVSPATTTAYTLTVTPSSGSAITQPLTVIVTPAPPLLPAITSFVASPATITAGSNSALTAVFTNGVGVITPGNIAVTSNVAVSVSPSATTAYTLTVTPSSGSAITQALTVTVTPAVPTITSFVASPSTITAGSSSSLTAVFTNGTGVITPGNIAVTSNVAVSISPATTTAYTLTVTPTTGAAITQQLTVTVQATVPTITSLAASPSTITAGSNSSITAVFTNGTGVITPGNIAVTSNVAVSVSPATTTSYTLTVTPTTGAAITQQLTVTVTPAVPTITSFVASPSTITTGSSSSLTAVFTNGVGVITPGNIAVTSNVAVSISPATTTAYTLTVTPTTGAAITQQLTVTVTSALPIITSFAASSSTITAGSGSSLTAVFTNGTGVITPGNIAVTSNVAVSVSPATTTAYTLTVTPTTGAAITQQLTVTVTFATYLIADGTYSIISKKSGLDLEVLNSSTAAGAAIVQATSTGSGNQIWKLTNLGSDYVELLNVNSNMVLEVATASIATQGAGTDQALNTSGTNQIWQVVVSGSYFVLTNKNSGWALDVSGQSMTSGAIIDHWPTNGQDNQLWTFTPAAYAPPVVTSVSITPNPAAATIGVQLQLTATVNGTGSVSNNVTWTVVSAQGSTLDPGTIDSKGLYTTPYPAPPTVTATATSIQDPYKSSKVIVTLSPPAASTGPALTVDAGNQTHAINPYVYGMDGDHIPAVMKAGNIPLTRSGGDAATRYNYQTDSYNSASDWWYQNEQGGGPYPVSYQENSSFNSQVADDISTGARTLATVPLIGWTTNRSSACSYSIAKYGAQKATEPYHPDCGNGILLNGNHVVNDPLDTSTAIDESFTTGWVKYLVKKFGTAAKGGVAIYDLDNEPSWWSGVHADVHPIAFTYDEVTNKGLSYAAAIKAADPTAEVAGPVMDNWMMYFYSATDVNAGYKAAPCYSPYSNPTDRDAHKGIPLIEYYLQQFAAKEKVTGVRLLDYLDIHAYYSGHYMGNTVAFVPAGDTGMQEVRLDSTRALWDPTYTDTYYTYPNYTTDSNYVTNCKPALKPLQLIPMLKQWVAADYPGTKTAIGEYNWGGLESMNGAVAQADVLGIFGREGLDIGAIWSPPDPIKQMPGLAAFQIYRNYDGANSTFGNMALASTSTNQGAISVYGALRTADNSVTIVVINKTYGDLTTTLSLANMTANGQAQVYLYSNADLTKIAKQTSLTVTPASPGSSISTTFPAQSITLFVIPKK